MDASVDFWIKELVVMLEKPADRVESTSGFLAVVDTIGRGWEAGNGSDMSKHNTFEAFFTGPKSEWDYRSCVVA